jgi:hypothetical protein
MENPVKVIWRTKNRYEKVQYHMYIFIGNVKNGALSKILERIRNQDFYNTLVNLPEKDVKILEKEYGETWYTHFFNTSHMDYTRQQLRSNKGRYTSLVEKYGAEWCKRNIDQPKGRKIIYSFANIIKDDRDRKALKKSRGAQPEIEADADFRTKLRQRNENLIQMIMEQEQVGGGKTWQQNLLQQEQVGGAKSNLDGLTDEQIAALGNAAWADDPSDDECWQPDPDNWPTAGAPEIPEQTGGDMEDVVSDEETGDEDGSDGYDEFQEDEERRTFESEMEMDMSEIEKIYKEEDEVDMKVHDTSRLIKAVLKEEGRRDFERTVPFDISRTDENYDQSLKDVYAKHYVTSDYIFMDDTIKIVKNKICCTMKQDPLIDPDGWLLPSRQYLWTEYPYDGHYERVMLGQKWIKRNELLQIDVEPNPNIRVYEKLKDNLKLLKESIKKYGSKIKRENDENLILNEYNEFMTNGEIHLVDLYHELGPAYKPDAESLKNLYDVYVRIYFPKIRFEDMRHVLDYLEGKKKVEGSKISQTFETLRNDLLLENEVMRYVENVKRNESAKYRPLFKENYITQSVIHVNLRDAGGATLVNKLDLYRIFNSFSVNADYPFVQYQIMENDKTWKFHEQTIYNRDNWNMVIKWFENAPYGISFKVRISEGGDVKYMAINLSDTGRIEYKTQWKEEDMATIEDIKRTYEYVKALIAKINTENVTSKTKLRIPENEEFKYAFINTIQKFELPNDFTIEHNDLSEFSRNFFPYVALVIEPRKRQSKIQRNVDKSKYGTYLRFKRVSRYENQLKMEQRIIYFMRNYDYNDLTLGLEIAKQFNITEAKAMEEIDRVRKLYPKLKKSRKIMKKMENIPKYKPPGIGIDIQGKMNERYKIRISGARDQEQTAQIIHFMNILIYLYIETYLYKRPERQELIEKLKKLTNIARRRNRVEEIVKPSKEMRSVKQMTMMDKKRIGFKPEKGQNQWTRSCQNSGNDKKRRPQLFTNTEDLQKIGYKQDSAGQWERKVKIGKREATLRAIRLVDQGDGAPHEIFYTCNPEDNGEHTFAGFLTRSMNPYGQCMPCCFKKDPLHSKNKEKREFHQKCLGEIKDGLPSKITGDKLYILQDTNKIQEGRFGFLPKYLDVFCNLMLNRTRRIKNHYLVATDSTGYFFKYGSRQEEHPFLNAICAIFDIDVVTLRDKLVKVLDADDDRIFTSLNNGDIRTQFTTRQAYIDFLRGTPYIDYDMVVDLLAIPGTLAPNGLNIVVFQKTVHVIKKSLEREKLKEDYYPICQNVENTGNISDPARKTVVVLRENRYYYPVVRVRKDDENTRTVEVERSFTWETTKENIVNHLSKYYQMNCCPETSDLLGRREVPNAKRMWRLLEDIGGNDRAKYQIVDRRNRCKYLVTRSGLLIPVKPSGTVYQIALKYDINKYVSDLETTASRLQDLYDKSAGKDKSTKDAEHSVPVKPIGVYYDENNGEKVHVVAIMSLYKDLVPVQPYWAKRKDFTERGWLVENRPVYDRIDQEITKGTEQNDQRIVMVTRDRFEHESYELFRLEFSEYLVSHPEVKAKLKRLVTGSDSLENRKSKIRELIYRLSDTDLYQLYKSSQRGAVRREQEGGNAAKDRFVVTRGPIKDDRLEGYRIDNHRKVCGSLGKDQCASNLHCSWSGDTCKYSTSRDMLVKFVNKISEELTSDDNLKMMEIMKEDEYFVSDIVDLNQYTERTGQKIVRSTSTNILRTLEEMFGKEMVPKLGRRKIIKGVETDFLQRNAEHPLKDMGDVQVQSVIDGINSVYRAFANGLYWLTHPFYDQSYRNLGYYSPLQTVLSNYYKSSVVQWLLNPANSAEVEEKLSETMRGFVKTSQLVQDFALKISNSLYNPTNGYVELYILSRIHDHPIIVYDENNQILYAFKNGLLYSKDMGLVPDEIRILKDSAVNIRFNFITNRLIPDDVEVIYTGSQANSSK